MPSKRAKNKSGYIEIKDNPITKVGVFPYLGSSIGAPDPNKIYYIFRSHNEIASDKALYSLKLTPVVDDHPDDF